MSLSWIPFNRPLMAGAEFDYMRSAMESGYVAGNGSFCKRAETEIAGIIGHPVLLTTSCTHALEMAALLLDIQEGDEVILPSFTFVSCANAFVLRGATPVFVDVLPGTFNVDPDAIAAAITVKTRAIVVVHYGGVACEMQRISSIAERNRIAIVEDSAHGLFGSYRGSPLGSFGRFATLSFHETKNVHCGEGGALILARGEEVERAEVIREKGTNRAAFFRGDVDKYQWVNMGSSYVISDLLAAFLCAQLERRQVIQQRRREIWWRYHSELSQIAEALGWSQPHVPLDGEMAYHLYFLVLSSAIERQHFIDYLKSCGIQAVFHYQQLHRSPFARALGIPAVSCPVADLAADRLVRLPFFFDLSERDQTRVIEAISTFVEVSAAHRS